MADTELTGDGSAPTIPRLGIEMHAVQRQTKAHAVVFVDTVDMDAVSADPVCRERFRRGVRFDYATQEGWPLEHTAVEYGTAIRLPEAHTCV